MRELRDSGASEAFIESVLAWDRPPPEALPDQYELWVENEPAMQLFWACATQWIVVAGFGSVYWQGIDRCRLESVMNMRGVRPEKRPRLLSDFEWIEKGARKGLNNQ